MGAVRRSCSSCPQTEARGRPRTWRLPLSGGEPVERGWESGREAPIPSPGCHILKCALPDPQLVPEDGGKLRVELQKQH